MVGGWPPMPQRSSEVRLLASSIGHGAGVGLLFGASLLLFNIAGLGVLAASGPQPATTLIFLAGSIFAFGPVVLCTVVPLALAGSEGGPPPK